MPEQWPSSIWRWFDRVERCACTTLRGAERGSFAHLSGDDHWQKWGRTARWRGPCFYENAAVIVTLGIVTDLQLPSSINAIKEQYATAILWLQPGVKNRKALLRKYLSLGDRQTNRKRRDYQSKIPDNNVRSTFLQRIRLPNPYSMDYSPALRVFNNKTRVFNNKTRRPLTHRLNNRICVL